MCDKCKVHAVWEDGLCIHCHFAKIHWERMRKKDATV